RVVVPARAAYSHSASLGRRYVLPVFRDNQARYAFESFQETLITGLRPRPQPSSFGLRAQPPSAKQASHSAKVIVKRPRANGLGIATGCCGLIVKSVFASASGSPIMNFPIGTTSIAGQNAHDCPLVRWSRKLSPEPGLTESAGSEGEVASSE